MTEKKLQLTQSEKQVIRLASLGLDLKSISSVLKVSEKTLKNRVRSVSRKMDKK